MMSVLGDLIGKGSLPCAPIVSWGWLQRLQFDVHKEEHVDLGELNTCPSVTTTMCPAWQRRWCPHATFERCQMCRIRLCFFFKIRLCIACVIRGHRLPSKAYCWISGGRSLASRTPISSCRSGQTLCVLSGGSLLRPSGLMSRRSRDRHGPSCLCARTSARPT